MSTPSHPTQFQPPQPTQQLPAWQPPPDQGQMTNPTLPGTGAPLPQRGNRMRVLRVVRVIVGMVVGLMAGMFAVGMVAVVGTVIGLYEVAPDFAQGLEGIIFLAGWVGGSWLVFHTWSMPVVRIVLPGWGQRPDQEADR